MSNNFGSSPINRTLRLSDSERNDAINDLARAVGEGRLTMEEFEDRSDDVMRASTHQDLVPVFQDIPARGSHEVKIYSQGEVTRAHNAGKKPKFATALSGSVVLAVASPTLILMSATMSNPWLLLGGAVTAALIPILWIMLYVAKVGPSSWHAPSVRQIERQQLREIRALTAHERAQQKMIEEKMWADRRMQAGEITGQAMDLAKRKFSEWNKNSHRRC